MKKFYCKKCKERIYRTRHSLRKHLREEHFIKSNLRTFEVGKKGRKIQTWWGEEEI